MQINANTHTKHRANINHTKPLKNNSKRSTSVTQAIGKHLEKIYCINIPL